MINSGNGAARGGGAKRRGALAAAEVQLEDEMQIDFGAEVVSSDGQKLGTVAGVVMDSENQQVRDVVIGSGLFDNDERLIAISAVTSSGDGKVVVDSTAEAATSLPRFDRQEYIEKPRTAPDALILPAAGVGGPIFYDSSYTGTGYTDYPATDSFFQAAPLDPPVVETRSNLEDFEVMLKKGTDVVGSDGKKIGSVDDINFNDDGFVASIVVKAGFLFHHDLTIPGTAVSEMDDNRVLLNITSDAAEGHTS